MILYFLIAKNERRRKLKSRRILKNRIFELRNFENNFYCYPVIYQMQLEKRSSSRLMEKMHPRRCCRLNE